MNPATVNTFLSSRLGKIERVRTQQLGNPHDNEVLKRPTRQKNNADILDSYPVKLEIPQEFICPLSGKIMDRPVYFYGNAQRYDDLTLSKKRFDDNPMDLDRLCHDVDLQNRIDAFMEEARQAQPRPRLS